MSANVSKSVLNLTEEIGNFIQYWGFKKIHGKVWALIFLSEKPVDANFLIDNLGVSKSLVSMTIKDLLVYNVILECPKEGPTLCYAPNLKIKDVIFDVLSQRESVMLLKIKAACRLASTSNSQGMETEISNKRLSQMTLMVDAAGSYLKKLLTLNEAKILPLFKKMNLKE